MIRAALLAAGLALAGPAAAQPTPAAPVDDAAGLLTPADAAAVAAALVALRTGTGVEGAVVTRAAGDGSPIEGQARRLFDAWGIGDAARDDGFLVLVLAAERAARIELGAGHDEGAALVAQDIMRHTILPRMRDGAASAAIRNGTDDVIAYIARPVAAGRAAERLPRRGIGLWLPWLVGGFFAFVAVQMARRFRRGRAGTAAPPGGAEPEGTGHPRRDGRDDRRGGGGGGFGGGQSGGGGATGRW